MVHTEIVLEGNGGKGLRCRLHFHTLFSFDSLVEAVRVASPVKDTSRLFIDNLHLVVHDHVFGILFEEGIGFEELMHGVYAFRFEGVLTEQLILGRQPFFDGHIAFFEGSNFASYVGQDEESLVVHVPRQRIVSLVGEFHGVQFLVDNEVEVIGHFVHPFAVVLHVEVFGFLHEGFHSGFGEELDKGFVFGEPLVHGQQEFSALGFVPLGNHFTSFGQQGCAEVALKVVERFDLSAVLFEELVFAAGYGSRDNQRGTCIVDKDGVHLIDNGIVVFALHEVTRVDGHIVAQVVEPEFVVGPEGNVAVVCFAAFVGVGLVFVDAIDREAVELVDGAHPFRVASGKVVIDSHYVHPFSRERVQENRERSHEGFPFTGRHFGHIAFVECHSAEELDIVVNHVPGDFVSTGEPVVLVDGFIPVDADKIFPLCGEFTVSVCCRYGNGRVLSEAPCRILDNGKDLGQNLIQDRFNGFIDVFFESVDFGGDSFLFVDFDVCRFEFGLEFGDSVFVFAEPFADKFFEGGDPCSQFIVREGLNLGVDGQDFIHDGLYCLAVFVGFAAEEEFEQAGSNTHI